MEQRDKVAVSDKITLTMDRPRVIEEFVPVTGQVFLQLLGPDGKIKHEQLVENLLVTAGKAHIADQLSSSPGESAMSHMALGTSSTAAAVGNTALGAETDRNALTSRTDSSGIISYVGTWAPGDGTNSALREAGVFNNSSGGTMLARAVYALIDKQAGDTLTITWAVTIGP